jgi:hypothetical protein
MKTLTKNEFRFDKYLFNISLFYRQIGVYRNLRTNEVKLNLEDSQTHRVLQTVRMSQNDYDNRLDESVSDNDAFYNHPRALDSAIEEFFMRDHWMRILEEEWTGGDEDEFFIGELDDA